MIRIRHGIWFLMFISTLGLRAQTKIHGIKVHHEYKTETDKLKLNGAGMRVQYNLNMYLGALYLKTKTSDAQKILNADEPMCMRIYIVSNLVTRERLLESIDDGFRRSTKGNTILIQSKINLLKSAFQEKINKHDDYHLVYEPGKGSSVFKNKEHILTIPGYEFKKALFGIWLSTEAAAAELKNMLLNHSR